MTSNPIKITNSVEKSIYSDIIGQEYIIQITLPVDYYKTDIQYPILYLLDGPIYVSMVTDIVRQLAELRSINELNIPDLIVVGIGYPVKRYYPEAFHLRIRDMSPTDDPDSYRNWMQYLPEIKNYNGRGRAENFLEFLREKLIPTIETEYRVDQNLRTIAGISSRGLFALYTLFTNPDTFRNYISMSPALFWSNKSIFKFIEILQKNKLKTDHKLFLSLGELENRDLEAFYELDQRVRNIDKLKVESVLFSDESHTTVFPVSICRGIISVYKNHYQ